MLCFKKDTREWYAIRSEQERDGETNQCLYWNNNIGWVDKDSATLFLGTDYILPIGGMWERAEMSDGEKWISIDDGLPAEENFVLVVRVVNGQMVRVPVTAYHHGAGQFATINWYAYNEADGITHWMPLPSYQKEKAE